MSPYRLGVLTVGPVLLIGASYFASRDYPNPQQAAWARHVSQVEQFATRVRSQTSQQLTEACCEAAERLEAKLPNSCCTLVRTPFVLAGDFSPQALDRLHRTTIQPLVSALWRSYFDHQPDQPILLVVLSNEDAYHDAAHCLDDYEPKSYSGYYQRSERRIVLNLSTGPGTLAHELTHALAQFDFPLMPEWFDEGLAALHEETDFAADGLLLVGLPNGRSKLLSQAIQAGTLPPLKTLITTQTFRGEGEGLNYAQVRGFCQYLQNRQLLSHFYRKFRLSVKEDPSGLRTLCEVLHVDTPDDIDPLFRKWLLAQP